MNLTPITLTGRRVRLEPLSTRHTSDLALAAADDSIWTVNRLDGQAPTEGRKRPARRRRSEVENDDFARFAVRIIRAHGRRISGGDVEGLADLFALRQELDTATQVAVDGLRGRGYSWAEIADRLGTTRQNTQQRWGTRRI